MGACPLGYTALLDMMYQLGYNKLNGESLFYCSLQLHTTRRVGDELLLSLVRARSSSWLPIHGVQGS